MRVWAGGVGWGGGRGESAEREKRKGNFCFLCPCSQPWQLYEGEGREGRGGGRWLAYYTFTVAWLVEWLALWWYGLPQKKTTSRPAVWFTEWCFFAQFLDYLFCPQNTIWDSRHDTINHDMDRPLSCYWISSSHNTWVLVLHCITQRTSDHWP